MPALARAGCLPFAKAVTSFANSHGGVLVYGVKDVREAAGTVQNVELGQGTTSLNQRLNQAVQPLVPGLKWIPVESPDDKGKGLLLLEVPPSPLAPHAVVQGHQLQFYWRHGRESVLMHEGDIERAYRARFQSRASARDLLDEARSWLPQASAQHPGRLYVLCVPAVQHGRLYLSPAEGVRRMSAVQRGRAAALIHRPFLGRHCHPRIRRLVASRSDTYDKSDRSGERAVVADSGAIAIWEEFLGADRLRSGTETWAEFGPAGVGARVTGYTSASMFTQSLVMLMVSMREILRGFEVSGVLDLVFGVEATGGVGWVTPHREVDGVLEDSGELEYSVGTETFEMPNPFGRLIGDVFNHVVSGFGFGFLNLSPVDEEGRFDKTWLTTHGYKFDAAVWEEKGLLIADELEG